MVAVAPPTEDVPKQGGDLARRAPVEHEQELALMLQAKAKRKLQQVAADSGLLMHVSIAN